MKTAAKPLAKQFESFVMGHPVLRRNVINLAQVRRRGNPYCWLLYIACTCIRSLLARGMQHLPRAAQGAAAGRSLAVYLLLGRLESNGGALNQLHLALPMLNLPILPTLLQWLHRLEVGITRGAEGKTGRAFVGDMSEEKAMELASKVASEGFLYGVRRVMLSLQFFGMAAGVVS